MSLFLIILIIAVSSVGAAIVYLFSASIIGSIGVDIAATLITFWIISYRLTKRFFTTVQPKWKPAILSTLSVIGVAVLLALPTLAELWSPKPNNANEAIIKSLTEYTIPLTTAQPQSGFVDLQALKPILEDKRVVALGEATHGTSEFFRMKHRLLEFLVREMGYEHFGMEISAEDGQVINDYISGGRGNPQEVLYWPWATTEVMEMLEWMRAYNMDTNTAHKLSFHGIDPIVGDRDPVMAENVAQILEQHGQQSKIVLWAHNIHISNAAGQLGYHLKQKFGSQAYLLGFEFNQGAFTSRMGSVHTYHVGAASPAYYAHALAKVSHPILYLDFQTMSRNPDLRAWLEKNQRSYEFQELHAIYRLNPTWHTLDTSWVELYDGVIFIEESTVAAGLQ